MQLQQKVSILTPFFEMMIIYLILINDPITHEDPMMQEGNEGDEDEDVSENGLLDDLLPPEQVATAVQTDSRL